MTAHHHDLDLIMALAAGSLSVDEARRAAAEIAGCEQCTLDLAAQRTALSAMAGLVAAPEARLTELEATRLHRALNDQLGHTGVAEPLRRADLPARAGRRWFNWAPLATAAAVFLALVVGGNAIRSLTDGGGGDDAGGEIAAADTADTADAGPTSDADSAATLPATEQTAGPELLQTDQATTTAAAAESQVGVTGAAGTTIADLAELRDRVEAALAVERTSLARSTESVLSFLDEDGGDADAFGPVPSEDACIGAASVFLKAPAESVVLGMIDLTNLGPTVVTVHTTADGMVQILLHDPVACTVVAEVP